MNWNRLKNWLLIGASAIALFAIYAFAATPPLPTPATSTAQPAGSSSSSRRGPTSGGSAAVEPVHMEWLDPQSGTYRSSRNLFTFYEPPPPKPVPPPDRDHDGVPDFKDNCPDVYNPDQADIDHNGIGDACQNPPPVPPPTPPPPPPPKPVPPEFTYKYIGTFGSAANPIASFSSSGEIVNVRVGETFGGKFILRSIGIESIDIGFVGFPPDERRRIPVGQ